MGKNKKEKPELTLENLNRAIRTYQREEVLYLIQHGILKDLPEDEKTATYQQLVSLQNMEILQSVARQDSENSFCFRMMMSAIHFLRLHVNVAASVCCIF